MDQDEDTAFADNYAERDQAKALREQARAGGLRFEAYLTKDQADWLLEQIERGRFADPSEAVFLTVQNFIEMEPHGDLRDELLRRADLLHLAAAEWRIPAEKMKMRRLHIVPLSTQAVALLTELKGITGAGRWLFPNHRRPHDVMSATTVNHALMSLGFASATVTAHDFRATASTRLRREAERLLGVHNDRHVLQHIFLGELLCFCQILLAVELRSLNECGTSGSQHRQ